MAERGSAAVDVARVRVMVVDDNEGYRESLLALLGTDDLSVVAQVGSGAEAIDLARVMMPDVVLMDVQMPEMDGVETTRRLKALDPALCVVALTGNDDHRVIRDMLVAGASCYLLKDSGGDEILEAVHRAAAGGGVLSADVTPSVIEELIEALGRERVRTHQLEVAQEALLERAARRHELVSRLGHELRTPVTVILGIARTLGASDLTAGERDELLDRLIARSSDLSHLVQRFEGAVDTGMTEWADVVQVTRDAVAGLERVRLDAPETPIMAAVNRQGAGRIVEELVDNALAFSPARSPVTVSVGLRAGAPEVRVTDRGPGIDPELAERMFAPLEQGEELDSRTHPGMGLGLALARMSAQAMDGDVVLESSGPEGSTFVWVVSGRPGRAAATT